MLPERGARRAKTLYDMIRGEASTLLGFCEYTRSRFKHSEPSYALQWNDISCLLYTAGRLTVISCTKRSAWGQLPGSSPLVLGTLVAIAPSLEGIEM